MAVSHYERGRINLCDLTGEGVDVELMISQLKIILSDSVLWDSFTKLKLKRLERKLSKVR